MTDIFVPSKVANARADFSIVRALCEVLHAADVRFPQQPNMDLFDGERSLREGPIGIAIVGQRNAGKSKFINLLLGRGAGVSPVSSLPGTTRTVLEIGRGDESAVAIGRDFAEYIPVTKESITKACLLYTSPSPRDS